MGNKAFSHGGNALHVQGEWARGEITGIASIVVEVMSFTQKLCSLGT